MIISDLTYLETVEKNENLEGGFDLGLQFSGYSLSNSGFAMGTYANASGAGNSLMATNTNVDSFSGGLVALKLPDGLLLP